MKTLQDIFDHVALHLLKQNKRATSRGGDGINGAGNCVYRAPDGSTCAAGCCIPDDEYDPKIEMGTVKGIFDKIAVGKVKPMPQFREICDINETRRGSLVWGLDLLTLLQKVHDENTPDVWPKVLKDAAALYDLSDKVVIEFKRDGEVEAAKKTE